MAPDADRVLHAYPRVYFACHTRHVRDPVSARLLSRHQASILDHLDPDAAIDLAGLAAHMGVTPATMSTNVERLVRMGYVDRVRDQRDRRRLCLRLTAAGARVRAASSVLDRDRVEAVLRRLDAGERETAIAGLETLARAAEDEMRRRARRPSPAGSAGERSRSWSSGR